MGHPDTQGQLQGTVGVAAAHLVTWGNGELTFSRNGPLHIQMESEAQRTLRLPALCEFPTSPPTPQVPASVPLGTHSHRCRSVLGQLLVSEGRDATPRGCAFPGGTGPGAGRDSTRGDGYTELSIKAAF